MGIDNIHILIEADVNTNSLIQAQSALEQMLVDAHRRGEHPWGSMRRDCPLCQLNK